MNRSFLFAAITLVLLTTGCPNDPDPLDPPPVASFDINPESAEVGVTINFQNTSQNATTFEWDFDDGTNSLDENPAHVYATEGNYSVKLTASNGDGSDEVSKHVKITPSSPCWTRLADMPEARHHHIAAAVNGRIYVMTGAGNIKGVEEFDPLTETWTKKADIPTPRQAATACVLNGKIYVIGGVSGVGFIFEELATIEVYDPVSDTWTEKTPMPTARTDLASVVLDGKIYVIGGIIGWPPEEFYNTIEMYDPETDEWTTLIPEDGFIPRWGLSACALNGKIYAMGGADGFSAPVYGLTTVQEYDPVGNKWFSRSDMPTGRFYFASAGVNGWIYAIGGTDVATNDFTGAIETVEAYNPLTDTWETKSSLPFGTQGSAASEMNQLIYVSGGVGENGDSYSYFYVYDPGCDTN